MADPPDSDDGDAVAMCRRGRYIDRAAAFPPRLCSSASSATVKISADVGAARFSSISRALAGSSAVHDPA